MHTYVRGTNLDDNRAASNPVVIVVDNVGKGQALHEHVHIPVYVANDHCAWVPWDLWDITLVGLVREAARVGHGEQRAIG